MDSKHPSPCLSVIGPSAKELQSPPPLPADEYLDQVFSDWNLLWKLVLHPCPKGRAANIFVPETTALFQGWSGSHSSCQSGSYDLTPLRCTFPCSHTFLVNVRRNFLLLWSRSTSKGCATPNWAFKVSRLTQRQNGLLHVIYSYLFTSALSAYRNGSEQLNPCYSSFFFFADDSLAPDGRPFGL